MCCRDAKSCVSKIGIKRHKKKRRKIMRLYKVVVPTELIRYFLIPL